MVDDEKEDTATVAIIEGNESGAAHELQELAVSGFSTAQDGQRSMAMPTILEECGGLPIWPSSWWHL